MFYWINQNELMWLEIQISNIKCLMFTVSMGRLIKQAIADETKSGHACKPYVEKSMLGEYTYCDSATQVDNTKVCISYLQHG